MDVNEQSRTTQLHATDGQLVEMLSGVLADPNLPTDRRMHLHHQITEILRTAHEDMYAESAAEMHRRALDTHGDHLPDLLWSVLVDPNLYTDLRMRLHRQIREVLERPHQPNPA